MLALIAALLVAQAANGPATPGGQSGARTESRESMSATFNTSTQAERGRVICRRERVTGSNRVERVCATVVQRDDAREASVRARDTNVPSDPELEPQ